MPVRRGTDFHVEPEEVFPGQAAVDAGPRFTCLYLETCDTMAPMRYRLARTGVCPTLPVGRLTPWNRWGTAPLGGAVEIGGPWRVARSGFEQWDQRRSDGTSSATSTKRGHA